jgi:hypothetical protein
MTAMVIVANNCSSKMTGTVRKPPYISRLVITDLRPQLSFAVFAILAITNQITDLALEKGSICS